MNNVSRYAGLTRQDAIAHRRAPERSPGFEMRQPSGAFRETTLTKRLNLFPVLGFISLNSFLMKFSGYRAYLRSSN